MATPILDKEYKEREKRAKELIAAGGCAALKFWSNTDALRLCPAEHKGEVKFEPLEGMVYISEWLDAAKKAVELISRGIKLIEPGQSPSPSLPETEQEDVKSQSIAFYDWASKLSPVDKISVHGRNGGFGPSNLTTEELYDNFIRWQKRQQSTTQNT